MKRFEKIFKILIILIIIQLVMFTFSYKVNAAEYVQGPDGGTAGGGPPAATTGGVQVEKVNPVVRFAATVAKILIVGAQIAVAGYFTVRLTIIGIQYFTTVAAYEKAANKNRMLWTLLEAALSYIGILVFGKIIGL